MICLGMNVDKKRAVRQGKVRGQRSTLCWFPENEELLLEVAVVETFEAASVASFVASHFVNGVVDSVEL